MLYGRKFLHLFPIFFSTHVQIRNGSFFINFIRQCLFKEARVVDENGDLHLEKLATHIEKLDEEIQSIAINMGRKCLRPPKSDNQCDRAFWYHKW